MKRGLVFTLCALALAASGRVAHAQLGATDVKLSLNLRYTDPFNPTEGGNLSLVAQTGSTKGIDGISAYISNIVAGAANAKYGNGVLATPGSGYSGANIKILMVMTLAAIPFVILLRKPKAAPAGGAPAAHMD